VALETVTAHFAKNGLDASWSEIGKTFGVTAARVGQIEQEAFVKIRALVFGTDDFPLLREAFANVSATVLERDLVEGEKYRERTRARNARAKAKVDAKRVRGEHHARG
jgi:hypothetical protein